MSFWWVEGNLINQMSAPYAMYERGNVCLGGEIIKLELYQLQTELIYFAKLITNGTIDYLGYVWKYLQRMLLYLKMLHN